MTRNGHFTIIKEIPLLPSDFERLNQLTTYGTAAEPGATTYSHHINKIHDVLYIGNYTEKMRILLFSWGKWTMV